MTTKIFQMKVKQSIQIGVNNFLPKFKFKTHLALSCERAKTHSGFWLYNFLITFSPSFA